MDYSELRKAYFRELGSLLRNLSRPEFPRNAISWGGSSDGEDRFEKWIAQEHQRRVLAGEATHTGSHPGEAFFRDLARKSKKISLSDPRVDHAATCPSCMNRILTLRQESRSRRQKVRVAAAVAVGALIAISLVVGRYVMERTPSAGNTVAVSQTVNLWDAGTVRGSSQVASSSPSDPLWHVTYSGK